MAEWQNGRMAEWYFVLTSHFCASLETKFAPNPKSVLAAQPITKDAKTAAYLSHTNSDVSNRGAYDVSGFIEMTSMLFMEMT